MIEVEVKGATGFGQKMDSTNMVDVTSITLDFSHKIVTINGKFKLPDTVDEEGNPVINKETTQPRAFELDMTGFKTFNFDVEGQKVMVEGSFPEEIDPPEEVPAEEPQPVV